MVTPSSPLYEVLIFSPKFCDKTKIVQIIARGPPKLLMTSNVDKEKILWKMGAFTLLQPQSISIGKMGR